MIEQIANADLSAKHPQNGRDIAEHTHGISGRNSRSQVYPAQYDGVEKRRPSFAPITKKDNGYELNFNDAALSELAKVILRDTLSLPYIFDPRVTGRVTVSTGGPVSKQELLSLLETVVSMNRGVLVKEAQLYRIVPETAVQKGSAVSVDYVSEARAIGAGYGVSVFPIKHVSATSILKMLETFVGRQGNLRASVENNLLVVRGSGKMRQQLLEVAGMFDVDWMRGQSAGLFILKNASPSEIIKELNSVFRVKANQQGNGVLTFNPIDRLNAILVLTQDINRLDDVEKWIGRLDKEGGEGDDYYVYRVENGKAKDLAEILTATFSGAGGGTSRSAEESQVSPGDSTIQLSSQSPPNNGPSFSDPTVSASEGARSPITSNSSPTFGTSSLSSGGSSSGGGGIRIIPDDLNNKLLIKAPARIYRKILKVLRRIDRPPLQVLINATLAEVTLNDSLKYGVQVFLQNRRNNDILAFGDARPNFDTNLVELDAASAGLSFIAGGFPNPKVVLDALSAKTAVRVVSSPSVVVLHNQSATLQVGDEVPISTRSSTSVTNPEAPVVNEIEFRNTGVILKVTPRVNSNGLVTMEVEQEISAVSNSTSTAVDGNLTPTISQRKIASTIAVQNGQMVVLGGLISEQVDRTKDSVPVLGEIPYFGDVMGNTSKGKTRTELVVFLQPRVIRKPVDAAKVAQELRAKMRSLAPRPAPWDADEATPQPQDQPISLKDHRRQPVQLRSGSHQLN